MRKDTCRHPQVSRNQGILAVSQSGVSESASDRTEEFLRRVIIGCPIEMFQLLKWGEKTDENGLHPHDTFGGTRSFCESQFSVRFPMSTIALNHLLSRLKEVALCPFWLSLKKMGCVRANHSECNGYFRGASFDIFASAAHV